MEVCENEKEFNQFLQEYQKLDNFVDLKMIDMMSILVEIDDISIRLQDKIYLPIPYCSNFKNIISRIHSTIESRN